MPAWVKGSKNEKTWAKAKKAVKGNWGAYKQPYAVVAKVYQNMGGQVKKATGESGPTACSSEDWKAFQAHNEAASVSAQAALLRPRAKEARRGWTFRSMREAEADLNKRSIRCILITEGPGNQVDRRWYTEAFIRDAAVKYEGARSFLNHATEEERQSRSEGDVKLQCGYYSGLFTKMVTDPETGRQVLGVLGNLNFDESEAGDEGLAKAAAQVEYAKRYPDSAEVYVGLSINGAGVPGTTRVINGQNWTEMVAVGRADSVDVVTRPARGGRFLALTESAKQESDMNKKLKKLLKQLGEAKLKADGEQDPGRKQTMEADVERLQLRVTEAAKEAEEADEAREDMEGADDDDGGDGADGDDAEPADKDEPDGDEDEEDEDGAGDAAPIAALKKHVPKQEGETDADHTDRIKKIHAVATAKPAAPAAESVSGLTPKQLRKKYPELFQGVAESVRREIGNRDRDVTGLKGRVRELEGQLQESRVKERIYNDTQEARKMLAEARIPKAFLTVGDLIGKSTEQKRREVERTQAMIEAMGGGSYNPEGGARGGTGGGEDELRGAARDFAKGSSRN